LKIREEFFVCFIELFAKLPKSPIVAGLREDLEKSGYILDDFSIDPRIGLGFENQIKFSAEQDGFFAYLIPLPKHNLEAFQLSASFKLKGRGFFHLDCPGNACGLDPSDHPESLIKGYEFCPHNTDTPKQQLTLLTGLAAICTLAKKEESSRE
jgi:hypothetical protein